MTDPDSDFVRVASAHLSSLFGEAIKNKGLSAGEIARACGGVESGWRNKLSGRRLFRLQDVLSLAATYDLNLLNLLAPAGGASDAAEITTIKDLVPPEHASLVEVHARRIPTLRDPMQPWTNLRHQLEAWVDAEVVSGRGAQLTEDVIVHQVLSALSALGLLSTTATIEQAKDNVRLTWRSPTSIVDLYFSTDAESTTNRATRGASPTKQAPAQRGDTQIVMSWVVGRGDTDPRLKSFHAQSRS